MEGREEVRKEKRGGLEGREEVRKEKRGGMEGREEEGGSKNILQERYAIRIRRKFDALLLAA